jgi:hypothetical protein
MLDKIINTSKKYNIYIYIMAIIPALIEKPDYVYVVDKETADNIKISLSTPSGGLYPIPKKFQNCIEHFINLTIFKKNKSIKILRIQPLIPISNGGLKFLDNKTPAYADSIIGIISFGGQTKYDAIIASRQLSSNLENLKLCTSISKSADVYIVTVKDIGASINVLISQITSSPQRSSPPPPLVLYHHLQKIYHNLHHLQFVEMDLYCHEDCHQMN